MSVIAYHGKIPNSTRQTWYEAWVEAVLGLEAPSVFLGGILARVWLSKVGKKGGKLL